MSDPLTFATEAERQRAREAVIAIGETADPAAWWLDEWLVNTFDRLYPVVEAPAPKGSGGVAALTEMMVRVGVDAFKSVNAPSPAFEAALDVLLLAYIRAANVLGQATALRDPLVRERVGAYDAARAEVVRIHREEVERGK